MFTILKTRLDSMHCPGNPDDKAVRKALKEAGVGRTRWYELAREIAG